MDTTTLAEVAQVVAAVVAALTLLGGLFVGLPKYFRYRSRTEKMRVVREVFESVVRYLGSGVEAERLAGAILLRRFFDPKSEQGQADTPYAAEAVSVISAVLRTLETGHLQKLLADSLTYAPHLRAADLQRTNLRLAFLSRDNEEDAPPLDARKADFYRADLSNASLKNIWADGAAFYQARMHDTTLRGARLVRANFFDADLQGANFNGARLRQAHFERAYLYQASFVQADLTEASFDEADLQGVNLDGATLTGASFAQARNLPLDLVTRLDEEGRYVGAEPFEAALVAARQARPRVFISKPGVTTLSQQAHINALLARLEEQGLEPERLDRNEYPPFGILAEIKRRMAGCAGTVVFGFRQVEIRDGQWRPGTDDHRPLANVHLSTPWNHIEAGMAAMSGMPLLVLSEEQVREGVFDISSGEDRLYNVQLTENQPLEAFDRLFANWCADVRDYDAERRPANGLPTEPAPQSESGAQALGTP